MLFTVAVHHTLNATFSVKLKLPQKVMRNLYRKFCRAEFITIQSSNIHLATKVESQANEVNLVPAQLWAIVLARINTVETCMEILT